jgi:hypothetical protein
VELKRRHVALVIEEGCHVVREEEIADHGKAARVVEGDRAAE